MPISSQDLNFVDAHCRALFVPSFLRLTSDFLVCLFVIGILGALNPLRAQNDGTLEWRYFLNGFASSSPALSPDGETIYIGFEQRTFGGVLAVPKNGSSQPWIRRLPDWVTSSPAVGPDGTIYVGCEDGRFYALSPANGQPRWSVDVGGFIDSSPAIGIDGTIYFGAGDSHLHAVSPEGVERWRFQVGDWIQSSPAIATDGTIYFGCKDGFVYAVNPDGSEKWRFRTAGNVYSSPAIGVDGTIFVGSNDQKMYALTPAGDKKWERFTNGEIWASPVLGADGTVLFASFDRFFYALNPSNGEVRWRTEYGSSSESTAAVRSDGTIIFGSDDGIVRALNPANGSMVWHFDTKAIPGDFIISSPIIAPDGAIYFGSLDGHLYKLYGNSSQLSSFSTWPAFRRDTRRTARAIATHSGGQLVNIATRAQVGDGKELIAGFVVQGVRERAYFVRAVGPGLSPFGINRFVPDPRLDLFSGRLQFASNDNWNEGDSLGFGITDTEEGVGAFPLTPGSKDAAVVFPLPPGQFTARVTSTDGRAGVALLEVYDGRGGDETGRIVNLSTRGHVGTGDDILISGVVVSGAGSVRLLVRGIGPGLQQFNVRGVLAQPRLEVFRGSTSLGSNLRWSSGSNRGDLAGAAALVRAFAVPETSADSAMLLNATAGEYTIQISGFGGSTGEAMVEVYVLP